LTTPTWSTLSIDTTLALRTSASRLAKEFTGTFGTETIERFLHSSYDQLAQQAPTRVCPLLLCQAAGIKASVWSWSSA
jgi:hypothetical protein